MPGKNEVFGKQECAEDGQKDIGQRLSVEFDDVVKFLYDDRHGNPTATG